MALHTTLPIYKAAYTLFDLITDLAKNMPRDFKHSIVGGVGVQFRVCQPGAHDQFIPSS